MTDTDRINRGNRQRGLRTSADLAAYLDGRNVEALKDVLMLELLPELRRLRAIEAAARERERAEEALADWVNSERDHLEAIRSDAIRALRAALEAKS